MGINLTVEIVVNTYDLEVLVYTRPNLRDDNLEYERFMGRDVLDDMYEHMKERPDVTTLFLSFPEQWLNIIEQRTLYERVKRYLPNLTKLTIKTHSVYIIQCTRAGCIGIVDNAIPETSDPSVKLYNDNHGNMFDVNRLNVVTSNGITQL